MKIIKWIVIVLVVLLLVFVVGGLLLPSKYEVTRVVTINAPADKVHAVIGDLKQWPKWGSWWRTYPDIKNDHTGDGVAAGSKLAFSSEKSGDGVIEIIKTDPATGLFTLVTFEPGKEDWKMNSDLMYSPDGTGTKVTWKAHGDMGGSLVGRWLGVTMFDSMMGKDFEKGLANAKEIIEGPVKP